MKKKPAASQRYDRNAAIWLQMWMTVRQTSSNRYDPSSAKNMTPIKLVTVTSAPCTRKENSVRHQISFHSVVVAPLHQRNLAAFSPAALAARTDFFPAARFTVRGGVSVMVPFPLLAAHFPAILTAPFRLEVINRKTQKSKIKLSKLPNKAIRTILPKLLLIAVSFSVSCEIALVGRFDNKSFD